MDDLIIEKSSWTSSIFHRYKSDLKKSRHEQKIDCSNQTRVWMIPQFFSRNPRPSVQMQKIHYGPVLLRQCESGTSQYISLPVLTECPASITGKCAKRGRRAFCDKDIEICGDCLPQCRTKRTVRDGVECVDCQIGKYNITYCLKLSLRVTNNLCHYTFS